MTLILFSAFLEFLGYININLKTALVKKKSFYGRLGLSLSR